MISIDCSHALSIKDNLLVFVADKLEALPILKSDQFYLDSVDNAEIDKIDVISAIEEFLDSVDLRKSFHIVPKGDTIVIEPLDDASMKEKLEDISDVDKNPFFSCTHCGFMTMYEEELKTHRFIHYI